MKIIRFLTVIILVSFAAIPAIADITSVTASLLDTPTTLSDGRAYFLAGVNYRVRVQAVATDNSGPGDWTSIVIQLREGVTTRHTITYLFAGDSTNSTTCETARTNNTGVYSNIDFIITFRPHWDLAPTTGEFAWGANSINVIVNEMAGTPATLNDTLSLNYGMCASIQVLNFDEDGVAADDRINPYYTAFNVTGAIVYYVSGRNITTRVVDVDATEISSAALVLDGTTNVGAADNNMANDFSVNVASGNVNVAVLGNHNWHVSCIMNTPGGPEPSANQLDFNCNRVDITQIHFINGGGTGPTSTPATADYYRSVNQPGTQIEVEAALQHASAGPAMIGNTTITVQNMTDLTTFTLQINSGQQIGIGNVPTPAVNLNTTELIQYRVYAVSGSAYDNEQNVPGRITSTPATVTLYWDKMDPPGNNEAAAVAETPFTGFGGALPSADSVQFTWTPLSLTGGPPYDGDFYTYRVYYKKSTAILWKMVDRTYPGFGANLTDMYQMGDITRGSIIVKGLEPLTTYDYYLTAVDLFGNEVETAAGDSDAQWKNKGAGETFGTFITSPFGVSLSINDGIQTWNEGNFETVADLVPVPANRPLRDTAVNVKITITSTMGQPDSVNLILADFATDGTDLVDSSNNLQGDYDRIACTRIGPEQWISTIPSTNRFMGMGRQLRFILEIVKTGNDPAYTDHDADFDPKENPTDISFIAIDPNDMEWTFAVTTPVTVTPWPTRVLNNVIDDRHPRAYPAYYLTHDAKVTIKVYDIKGRPVATLIDNAFRKGGQNIKEDGWAGTNKARKKLGPGLYYIYFHATKVDSKKVILNEFKKVVVAR